MKQPTKREPLTRDRILRAALAIVDREGLEAISMRRIGEALGVEAMSIYNHVANKAAILDGIFETILGELPVAKPSSSWRLGLQERARAFRSVLRDHPNALPLFATRPAVTPASITLVEDGLALLRRAGFTAEHALMAFQSLVAFVVCHAIASYAPDPSDAISEPAYDELSEAQFPHVREVAKLLITYDVEQEFEVGLEAMLAGLESQRTQTRRHAR